MRKALTLTIVVALLAACSQPGPAPSPSQWRPPDRYAYTLDSRCGEQLLIGRIRLWVDSGAVVHAEGLDEPGRRLAEVPLENLPTLATLVGYYNDAVGSGSDVAVLEADPADGHPRRIEIDHSERSMDDESCFAIDEYEVGATP
jgi:hypothetical protein